MADELDALTVDYISATYAEDGVILPVLDDVTFAVSAGEFVALIGPSGCGKSTVLNIIAGLIEPDQGRIALNGATVAAQERIGRSGYMFQSDLLLPWRTAVDNAALALQIQGAGRAEARLRAGEWFAQLGLAGFEAAYPAQLSGGMRQRVAFVRTLLGGQHLILLDEPFGSLDALTRASAQDWLAQAIATDRRSVLLVTHDVDEAIMLADRVIVFSDRPGHVVHQEIIGFPRPRVRDMLATSAFAAHRLRLLARLGVILGVSEQC